MLTLKEKQVRCRKAHPCVWCAEDLLGGESARYRSGIYEGDFFSDYWHLDCWDAMIKSDLGYEESFNPRDQLRGKTYEESHGL